MGSSTGGWRSVSVWWGARSSEDVAALPDIGVEDWRAMLATNLDGAFHVMQRCAAAWAS